MKRLFAILALVPLCATVHAGGYCYPQRYQQKYYAPAYKAPVYYQPQITLIGIPVPYPYVHPVAKQGYTQYGYSLGSYTNKPLDLTLAFTQAARLTQDAQKLSGDGLAGVQAIIETEGTNQARIAEIEAKGRTAVATLRASEPGDGVSASSSSRIQLSTGNGGRHRVEVEDEEPPLPRDPRPEAPDVVDVIQAKCLKCHSGAEPKGKLNLTKYAGFDEAKRLRVLARITSNDPAKRMPPEGEAVLTVDEFRAFFAD